MAVKETCKQRQRQQWQRLRQLAGRTCQQSHGVQCTLALAKDVGRHLIVLLLCIDSTDGRGCSHSEKKNQAAGAATFPPSRISQAWERRTGSAEGCTTHAQQLSAPAAAVGAWRASVRPAARPTCRGALQVAFLVCAVGLVQERLLVYVRGHKLLI